jgi:hypothetical protein
MKSLKTVVYLLVGISSIIMSCTGEDNKPKQIESDSINSKNKESTTSKELKTGGIYFIKDGKNEYYLVKILAIDNFAVHLRTYADKFIKRPENINSSNLDILIGHSPIDKEGFLTDNPELLNVEDVKETELEGYKIYIEEMKKQN